MPQLGESVVEGTVGKWLVQEGQRVEKDQAVVEILTDKADSEIPSSASGVLVKALVAEGATVAVGDDLFEVDETATASQATAAAAPKAAAAPEKSAGDKALAAKGAAAKSKAAAAESAAPPAAQVEGAAGGRVDRRMSSSEVPAPPSVRRMAREHGVDLQSVLQGNGARVTRDQLERAATAPPTPAAPAAAPTRTGHFKPEPYMPKPGDEVVPFSRRRRIIADHMVYSKQTAPHVVTVAECDIHRTSVLRDQHKGALKKEGINLTFLAFVAAATTKALREHPEINARVLDDAYVKLAETNLGIAVETEQGLVVPVIKHADELTVRGLARAIDDTAAKARTGKLTPDDLSGKTFTISNPGRKGNLFGAAIISQPNVGILRIGEIKKRVVVVERDGEDVMAIHPVMYMALSYDHRIVDGVMANSFLFRIAELMETADFSI